MRLRAPAGCSSVSHGEQLIKVDPTGHVEVQDETAQALIPHGFVHVVTIDEQPAKESKDEEPVEQLNRRELFAFLKANGVSIQLPITNGELRDLAEKTRKSQINGVDPRKKGG